MAGSLGISVILKRIGQNSILELLNRGKPSILILIEIVFDSVAFLKIFRMQFSRPWCQYCPPFAYFVVVISCGVFNRVLGSSGKIFDISELIILNSDFRATWVIWWLIAHVRKWERNRLFFSNSLSYANHSSLSAFSNWLKFELFPMILSLSISISS